MTTMPHCALGSAWRLLGSRSGVCDSDQPGREVATVRVSLPALEVRAEQGFCLSRCVPSCVRHLVPVPGHHPDALWGCPWCWMAVAVAGSVHGAWGSPATTSASATPARAWSASRGRALAAEGPCASVSRFAGLREGAWGRSRPRGPESASGPPASASFQPPGRCTFRPAGPGGPPLPGPLPTSLPDLCLALPT